MTNKLKTSHLHQNALPGGNRYANEGAADFLGINPGTLAKWRSIGHPFIPSHKVGKKVVYHEADLQAYLDEHRIVEVST